MDYNGQDTRPFDKAVDILMHIGSDNYDVPTILLEGKYWGISKRIPLNSIPDGFIPYFSKLFGWHSEAIPFVTAEEYSLVDLVAELVERELLKPEILQEDWNWDGSVPPLEPMDYVPPFTLAVTCAIQADKKQRAELEKKYKIVWQGGVIFSTLLGPIEYVVKEGEEDVPEEIRGDSRIQAVKVTQYFDKDGNPISSDGKGE